MLNKKLLAGAAASLALMSVVGTADAALLTISPVAGNDFTTDGSNNVLGSGVTLNWNAGLTVTPGATLTYYYSGSESGFVNTLNAPDGFTHAEDNTQPGSIPGTQLHTLTFTGGAPLSFTWDGDGVGIGTGNVLKSIAFAYLDPATWTVTTNPTNWVLFALDDGGGSSPIGSDRDFDDYVGVLHAVPLPAAVWLFGSALLGLAGIGYRRKTGYQA